jgi:hypothetical protein
MSTTSPTASTLNAPENRPVSNTVFTNITPVDYTMRSQQYVGESQQNVEFIRNWIMRFSPNERDELLRVNKLANTLQKSEDEYKDPLNMSMRQFAKEWANKNMEAVADLMKWLSNLGEYNNYFNDIDSSRQWFTGIYMIIRDFIAIFWKNQRAIYIGITLLLLVFFIFVIETAETSYRSLSPVTPLQTSSLSVGENGVRYMMIPVNTNMR